MIATEKRRLEGDLRGMQQELDNLMNQIKNSEEKTKKALADAGLKSNFDLFSAAAFSSALFHSTFFLSHFSPLAPQRHSFKDMH